MSSNEDQETFLRHPLRKELTVFKLEKQPRLNWAVNGDELIHRIHTSIADATGRPMTGSSMTLTSSEHIYKYYRYEFRDLGLETALAVVPQQGSDWLLGVEANNRDQAEKEGHLWATAVLRAETELGQNQEFPYWAVVVPSNSNGSREIMLEESLDIAEVQMRRSPHSYARYKRDPEVRRLGGGGTVEFLYPVVMRGTASGYQWSDAAKIANTQILEICACLTLNTGALWEVVAAPQPYELSPASLPTSEDISLKDADDLYYEHTHMSISVDFVERALNRMQTDTATAELLAAYYHAQKIEEQSPSLAALVYVSIVEAIGSQFVPLSPCRCCQGCPQKVGYSGRFREALKIVVPEHEAKRLSKLYDKRSRTAHQGTLYGTEFRLRSMSNVFIQDPSDYFLYYEVRHIGAAARGLLHMLVEDQIPFER